MANNFVDYSNATSITTAISGKIKERAKIFYGTDAEWDLLTTAQKCQYDYKASEESDEQAEPDPLTPSQINSLIGLLG